MSSICTPSHGLENQLKCVLLVLLPGYDALFRRGCVHIERLNSVKRGCAYVKAIYEAGSYGCAKTSNGLWPRGLRSHSSRN